MVSIDFPEEMMRLSRLLDAGLEMLRTQAVDLADAENAYRKGVAEAWQQCPNDAAGVKAGEREWTAARRESWVDAECSDLRRKRDIAEGMRRAADQAVKARQTQISALQSLLAAERAEAEFARTGQAA